MESLGFERTIEELREAGFSESDIQAALQNVHDYREKTARLHDEWIRRAYGQDERN